MTIPSTNKIRNNSEQPGSPVETFNPDGSFTGVRTLLIPWQTRFAFINAQLGQLYPYSEGLPPSVGLPLCISARLKNFGSLLDPVSGDSSLISDSAGCEVELTYGNPGQNVSIPPYVHPTYGNIEESFEPSAEFVTLDHSRFRWGATEADDKLEPQEAPGKLLRGADWVLRRTQANAVSQQLILLPGTSNSEALSAASLGINFAAEQLMFGTPLIERNVDGTFTITYRFSIRPNGWNKVWRAKTQTWSPIYVQNDVSSWVVYKNYPPVVWSTYL